MSDPKTVGTMSLLGGHPVLDFVNTVDSRIGRIGPDYLGSYWDVLVFAERTMLIGPDDAAALARLSEEDPVAAAESFRRATDLREALYRICRSEAEGKAANAADINHLERAVRQACGRRMLDAGPSGLSWTMPAGADLDTISDRIALAAIDLLIDKKPLRRTIRECPGRNCGWLFLDSSRGGRRHWCSDRTCGTGARVRRFRSG